MYIVTCTVIHKYIFGYNVMEQMTNLHKILEYRPFLHLLPSHYCHCEGAINLFAKIEEPFCFTLKWIEIERCDGLWFNVQL